MNDINSLIDSFSEELITFRRELHSEPELGFREFETTKKIKDFLLKEGISSKKFEQSTGLYTYLEPEDLKSSEKNSDNKTIMLRADIDALPIQDEKTVSYHSKRPGVMHACGHDVHSAILVGVLRALSKRKETLPCRVKGIFQPAEELGEGANSLIKQGVLSGVDYAVGLHVDPTIPLGTIAIRNGTINAGIIDFELRFNGTTAHAGRPHMGVDAIAATAHFISTCYALTPRKRDSREAVVLHFGVIEGGAASNIVAESCVVRGGIRGFSNEVTKQTLEDIKKIGEATAITFNASFELKVNVQLAPVLNDKTVAEAIQRAAVSIVGEDRVITDLPTSMGGEDFGAYSMEIPGAMFRLGVDTIRSKPPYLHTPTFDIDESAIAIGCKIMAKTVYELSKDN